MRLLHIDASPRANRSRSRVVADRFVAALPRSVTVTRLDLWDAALPSLGGDMIEGRYALIMGEEVDGDIAGEWGAVRARAEAFLAHDAYLISTPMWNFSIPYPLKHFIDVVTQPGMTFRNDAAGNVEGLASGRRAVVIAASAMPFAADKTLAPLDFQMRYLETWLGFIGIDRTDVINVSPTFGPEEAVRQAVEAASGEAERLARALSGGS